MGRTTRAADDLAGDTLLVELAETGPLAEELGVRELDKVDLVPARRAKGQQGRRGRRHPSESRGGVLSTESLDELDVLGLSAALVENAKVSLALVEGLGALAESTRESVVDESLLEDVLQNPQQSAPRLSSHFP